MVTIGGVTATVEEVAQVLDALYDVAGSTVAVSRCEFAMSRTVT